MTDDKTGHPIERLANKWVVRTLDVRRHAAEQIAAGDMNQEELGKASGYASAMGQVMFDLGAATPEILELEKTAIKAAETTQRANDRLTIVIHAMLDELQSDVALMECTPRTAAVLSKIQDWRQAIETTEK